MKKFLLFCFSLISLYGIAQEKIEYEAGISAKDVPQKSKIFVNDAFPEHRKIKWYHEYGTENNYEAKFKYHKRRFSVEFDTLGNLIDVELKVKWKEIDKEVRQNIKVQMDSIYKRHRMFRIQQQVKGTEIEVKEILLKEKFNTNTITAYEIDVKGKTKEGTFLYEHLFDKKGILIKTLHIIPPNMDFIEY